MSDTSPATSPVPGPAHPAYPSFETGRFFRTDDLLWKVVAVAAAVVAAVPLAGFVAYVATRPHHHRPVAYPVTSVLTPPVASITPVFALPRLGGGSPVALSSTRGSPTIVNFFASWCRDYQAELGDFAALPARSQGHAAVIGVDANDADSAAARALLARVHATDAVGVASQVATATAYWLGALPVTFFLEAQVRADHVALGTRSASALAHWTAVRTGIAG